MKDQDKSKKAPALRKFQEMRIMPWILFGVTFLIIAIAGIRFAYLNLKVVTNPGITKGRILLIRTGSSFRDVLDSLRSGRILTDESAFIWLAERKQYPDKIIPGRYRIKGGMKNFELVKLLRTGNQDPVRVILQNYRTVGEMAGKLTHKLEKDSTTWIHYFTNVQMLKKYGVNKENFFSLIIPDTYEFYWNTTPDNFMQKMEKAYKQFWNDGRIKSAGKLGLSIPQVVVLASIVEKETNHPDEKKVIAGVYLNRLSVGMALQADPTVIFAWKDFTIKRVTGKYTEIDSPYNTYLHTGLPPGPICLPSVSSIDAVLNAEKNRYIYFCANADLSGHHSFASNLTEHLQNARKYHQALNHRNIH